MPQPNSLPVFDQTALREFLAPETKALEEAHERQLSLANMNVDWEDLESFELTDAAKKEHQQRKMALEGKLADLSLRGRQIYI